MLLRRLQYPRTTGLILRRTYPELYKSHIVKLFEEYPELRPGYNDQRKELVLGNGARMFFGSAEHESDMSAFYSAEFADILVDEAQEFSQQELEQLSGSCRCTSNPDLTPKMIHTFMPGISESGRPPKGLPYLKRVYVDRDLRGEELRQKWAFVQAFSWDNIEWARKELGHCRDELGGWRVSPGGVSEEEFYSWGEAERREFFIAQTEYGKNLASITNKYLRDAWLYGKWDVFQGQYFPNFDYERHTIEPEEIEIKRWHKRWISMDWGFDHPAVVYWHAEDEEGNVVTYREEWARERGESEWGAIIGELSGGERIQAFYMSWDAFGRLNKHTRKSITEMIGDALRGNVPRPTSAGQDAGSRVSGWRLMHQLLDSGTWRISRACPKLIECLPTLVRDMERNPEDVLKVDYSENYLGDDPADAARYGLQNMLAPARVPREERFDREIQKALGDPEDPDYNAAYRKHMSLLAAERERQIRHPRSRTLRWRRRH